ncbi:MAG: RnfABCDGE type electron transport complex subunit D [Bacilli bacterium]|nr:RnfABCDGE type electron transport complex subunit D [Bacilli bacterium]
MQFRMSPSPYQRGKRTTTQIMLELTAVLAVVWLVSIIMNFINLGSSYGVKTILIGVVSILASLVVDVIAALAYKKKGFKEIRDYVINSYSYVTALIFALTLPLGVTYFAVITGSMFATFFGKVVFGGFGYNIVNPAGIGRIFVTVSFAMAVPNIPGFVDATTGATVTTGINWITGQLSGNWSMADLFLGNYLGAIGETSTLVLLIAGLYMIIRNLCDYRSMVSYLGGVFIITFFLGLMMKVTNPLDYAVIHLLTGGLAFGAVFMITDPVTAPTSPLGKVIYGLGAAFLTVLIRVNGSLPEGVVFSIVLMNLIVPLLDNAIKGKTIDNLTKRGIIVAAIIIVAVLLNYGVVLLGGAL